MVCLKFRSIFILSSLCVIGLSPTSVLATDDCKLDENIKERFIPVELYIGAEWNGSESINYPAIDKVQTKVDPNGKVLKSHGTVQIKGPIDWTDPATGRQLKGYERWVPLKGGKKSKEVIGVTTNQDGIGRFWDERWDKWGIVAYEDEAKFPIGKWNQGEKRELIFKRHFKGGKFREQKTILTIEKLSCTYGKFKNAMQYRFQSPRRNGGMVDYRYLFIPGRGSSLTKELSGG